MKTKITSIITLAIITAAFAALSLTGCDNSTTPENGGGLKDPSASSTKAITAFSFTNPAATGTINETAKTISVTVPFGTSVTALTPTVTHTGASYSPTGAQNFTSPVIYTVTAHDGSTQPYTVTVTVPVSKPIALIYYGITEIPQNGTIDVGNVLYTLSTTISITIKNTGNLPLLFDVANITITGTDALSFTRTTYPATSIEAGGQTQFNINCEPIKVGENNAVLTIPTNDSSRNQIIVNLRVTGIQGYPVIELKQDTITHNSLTPVDFGTVELEQIKTLNFTIKNTGNITLNLTGSPFVNSSNSEFTVSSQPTSVSLVPEATTTFSIQYTPTAEGEITSTITIENNSEETPYTFIVKGNGYKKKPQIKIYDVDIEIPQNGRLSAGDVTYTQYNYIEVIIKNTGDLPLTIVPSDISITGMDAAAFTRTTSPATTIQPGGQTKFSIKCEPVKVGENNAVLTIPSNDGLRNPFVINLDVTGV